MPITLQHVGNKGYGTYANGKALPTVRAATGQLQLELPAGFSGSVTVKFTEPFYWRTAEIISLACILCRAVVQLISHNRTKYKKWALFYRRYLHRESAFTKSTIPRK